MTVKHWVILKCPSFIRNIGLVPENEWTQTSFKWWIMIYMQFTILLQLRWPRFIIYPCLRWSWSHSHVFDQNNQFISDFSPKSLFIMFQQATFMIKKQTSKFEPLKISNIRQNGREAKTINIHLISMGTVKIEWMTKTHSICMKKPSSGQ
jgi:hypothetical protein